MATPQAPEQTAPPPVAPPPPETSAPDPVTVVTSEPVPRTPGPVEPVDQGTDVVIASTTDSQAAVEAAIHGKLPDPVPPPAPKTTATTPDDGETPPPDATEAGKTLAGRKKSLQERLAEETYAREENRRRAERAEADALALRQRMADLEAGRVPLAKPPDPPPIETKTPEPPPKPKLEDFSGQPDPYGAWVEALSDWKSDRAIEKVRAEVAAARTQDQQQTQAATAAAQQAETNRRLVESYNQRSQQFAASVEGGTAKYLETVQTAINALANDPRGAVAPPPLMQAHLVESDHGPALFYHLVQDQEEYRRIVALPAGKMITALGRYEERLDAAGKLKTAAAPPPQTTVTVAPPPSPISAAARALDALASSSSSPTTTTTAPPPPLAGGRGATTAPVPLDELPYADFKKQRNAADRIRH